MHGNLAKVLFVVLCSIAAYLFWLHQEKTYENKGRLTVHKRTDTVVLSWQAEIAVPMVRRFEEAYGEWASQTKVFVIDLNSPGGSLREGNRLIELITKMKRNHHVVTRVRADNYCLSMCVPIYLQGQTRVAAASSNWMFHEPQQVDYFTGEDGDGPEFERTYFNDRFFERHFVNSEINPAWREQLKLEWQGKDIWRTGQQLVDEGANIVLELQ